MRVKTVRVIQFVLVCGLIACGAKSPTNPTPTAGNTLTITSAGVSPKNLQLAIGTRVLFVNNDSRSHSMTSDPHPDHTDCPELNQVGFLTAGQSRESGNLVTARSCGYHDHDNPASTTLQGTITIK